MAELKERGKNACIVVFIIWLLSFCGLCICEMKARDERGRSMMWGGWGGWRQRDRVKKN